MSSSLKLPLTQMLYRTISKLADTVLNFTYLHWRQLDISHKSTVMLIFQQSTLLFFTVPISIVSTTCSET